MAGAPLEFVISVDTSKSQGPVEQVAGESSSFACSAAMEEQDGEDHGIGLRQGMEEFRHATPEERAAVIVNYNNTFVTIA